MSLGELWPDGSATRINSFSGVAGEFAESLSVARTAAPLSISESCPRPCPSSLSWPSLLGNQYRPVEFREMRNAPRSAAAHGAFGRGGHKLEVRGYCPKSYSLSSVVAALNSSLRSSTAEKESRRGDQRSMGGTFWGTCTLSHTPVHQIGSTSRPVCPFVAANTSQDKRTNTAALPR